MVRLSRRAAFLDRDGTLNVRPSEHAYVAEPSDLVLLPGAIEGAARLARAGYVLAVVSNQRGVARGLVERATLRAIEERIQQSLAAYDCAIERFSYCTHEDDAACACRKPRPGLILDAARELDVDLRASWMIGDSESDVLAGEAAGCRTALIAAAPQDSAPDLVAPSLAAASRLIARSVAGPDRPRIPRSMPRT